MTLKLKKGPTPLYYQLERALRRRILTAQMAPSSKFPTERQIGEEFGVSRITVRQALMNLENEGLLSREQVLRIPYPFLFPLILLFCLIGSYSLSNNKYDVFIVIFGVIGYLMKKVRFEGAPLLLGMVLGLMMEDALRQALIMSAGSFRIFIERPISAGFILTAIALLAIPVLWGGRSS